MPQSPNKNRKPKPRRLKLVAKNPAVIGATIDSWVASAEAEDCDPLNMAGAPAWAEAALMEAVKMILPGKKIPADGKCGPEFIGELAGRQQALARLFVGEIPMSAEMQADWEKIQKQSAALPQTPEREARKEQVANDFRNMVRANNQAIPELMAAALASSHEDSLKFQKGLMRGMSLVAGELDAGKINQRYTQVFAVLGLHWRRYHECRSVAEVHRKLCADLGEQRVGSLKHFEERVARKIGMKFGPAGRPSRRK